MRTMMLNINKSFMNAKEQMKNKIMTEGRMFELTRKYLRNMEIRHWCFLCFGAPEEVSALVHGRNVILHSFGTTRNKQSEMTGRALPNALVAKGAELRSEILAFARMTGKKEWSWMTGKEEQSGMTRNKSNVILSPLWASGSIVRRSMVRIVKVACGSKDSDGAFAFSAQPLRMTGNIKNNGLVNVVICNGGVIC